MTRIPTTATIRMRIPSTKCLPSSDRGHVRFLIFAKAPIAGAVKTRLAREIGAVAATQWYRRCLARTISAAKHAGIDFTISAAPSAEAFRRASPHRSHLSNQCAGDLGRRMAIAARACHGAAIVIGSDIPDLSPRLLRSALKNVPRFDLLIGPSRDGGYYLIGFRTPAHAFRLFRSVRWSTPYTLTDTLMNAPRHWRIGFLSMLRDVDCAGDLKNLTRRRGAAENSAQLRPSTIVSRHPAAQVPSIV